MSNCDLCNQEVDERQLTDQCDHYLCLSCDGKYSDEELFAILAQIEELNEMFNRRARS